MAACVFGASGLKESNLSHVRPKARTFLADGLKTQKMLQLDAMVLSTREKKLFKAPVPVPVVAAPVVEAAATNGSSSSQSLSLMKLKHSSGGIQTLLDRAADEGLVILRSPRVGYFRRCGTIKGKRAPPSCEEKDIVKEGQALCFIEQLGGEIPV